MGADFFWQWIAPSGLGVIAALATSWGFMKANLQTALKDIEKLKEEMTTKFDKEEERMDMKYTMLVSACREYRQECKHAQSVDSERLERKLDKLDHELSCLQENVIRFINEINKDLQFLKARLQ